MIPNLFFFACFYVFVCANYFITMRIFVIFAKNNNITFFTSVPLKLGRIKKLNKLGPFGPNRSLSF